MKSVVSKTCLLLLAPALILGPGACGDFDADESFRWGTGQRIDVEQTIQDLIQTGGGWAGNRVNGTLHVAVIDALTRTPIAGADLFFGVPNNNVHHMVTDANGRVEWDPDPGFDTRVVIAAVAGYETLMVDHFTPMPSSFSPRIYVLPLRPQSLSRYARVRGIVVNVNSTDHRKFEVSHIHAVRPLESPFSRLDRDGFREGGSSLFFAPPTLPGDWAALEIDQGHPSNFVRGQTAGTGAGTIEDLSQGLPATPPSFVGLAGGAAFTFNPSNGFSQVNTDASRARVLCFLSGAHAPLVTGTGPVDAGFNSFPLTTVTGIGEELFRGALHVEGQEGTCDTFWDIPDILQAITQGIDVYSPPGNLNPMDGMKNVQPGPSLYWEDWGSGPTGFTEVVLFDPMRDFPENLAWRIWKSRDPTFSGGGVTAQPALVPQSHDGYNLKFEKEYAWRVRRIQNPLMKQTDSPLSYGLLPREASAITSTRPHRFIISIQGPADANQTNEMVARLIEQGGGVAGIPNNTFIVVIDEATGLPLSGVEVFEGMTPAVSIGFTDGNGSIQGSPNQDLTACMAGYENTSFIGVNGQVFVIPLRATAPNAGYARVTGQVTNITSPDTTKAVVSTLGWVLADRAELQNSPDSYDLTVREGLPPVLTALHLSGGILSEFRWEAPGGATARGVPRTVDIPFQGASTHSVVQVAGPTTSSFPFARPPNATGMASARAFIRGGGASSSPWDTLVVGWGTVTTGPDEFTLQGARVPLVRSLWGSLVFTDMNQGSMEARFRLADLGRQVKQINFLNHPSLNNPGNAASVGGENLGLAFNQTIGDHNRAGPAVFYIEDPSQGSPPASYKWRLFVWPEVQGNPIWVYLPNLPGSPSAYELQGGNHMYSWFIRQYEGNYWHENPDHNSNPVRFGKLSFAWLDRYLSFLAETPPWTFFSN
ncbi:MAG: hypothetical protein ACYTHM_11560 [Planctomycetota bacterium]